ncbi:MAG: MaoC family dehydratase [Deltaproteobacteria bacterium]|nr:MaoC family dehydratase [Deltaproteobacteria bacterium]
MDTKILTRGDNFYEDFHVGDVIVHGRGRTVSDEHMAWTNIVLNTAQLHFNQAMVDADPKTYFGGRRVVYGGIVFAFVCGLASEECEENALMHLSYDEGRHLNPVFAGDTLFAETTVLAKSDTDPRINTCGAPGAGPGSCGVVKMLLHGRNQKGEVVLEITREMLLRKRS